ncbi:hypothetical protein GC175_25445, partial [bacterium]|nr:hypothetical protein [bacterium]
LVDQLPKNRTGKILKRILREQGASLQVVGDSAQSAPRHSPLASPDQGMGMIYPALGRSILGTLLADGPAQLGVIPARLSPSGEIVRQADNLLSRLPAATNAYLAAALQAVTAAERPTLLEDYLRKEIAQVLRLPVSMQIDHADHLFEMGFDSLMAVELTNRIQNALGVHLHSTLIFEHPTLGSLIEYLVAGSKEHGKKSALVPMQKVYRSEPIPLSIAQQRLWFNQISNPIASYNILTPFHLVGKLDIAALEHSLTALQERHEVLRTTFPTVNGKPAQAIGTAQPVKIDPVHLPGLEEAERTAICERLIRQEVESLCDLATGPLWRVTLVQFAEDVYFLLLVFNHILLDAGSLVQLQEELGLLYNGYRQDRAIELPPLLFDYADYAYWQQRSFTPDLIESRVQQWVERLSSEEPLFELHSTRPRPKTDNFHAKKLPFATSTAQLQQLQSLQTTTGATLFNTFLAAWTALLYRYGKGETMVVGSPFSNRPRQELDGIVGHWGSMLLLPLHFHANMTFLELIQQVNQAKQYAIANDVPIDQLVPALPAPRKRNNLPHQVLFSFTPGQMTNRLQLDGLTATSLETKDAMLRPEIALTIWEENSTAGMRLAGAWAYKLDFFDSAFVEGMLEDFHRLLDVLINDPGCRIGTVFLPNWHKSLESIQNASNAAVMTPSS